MSGVPGWASLSRRAAHVLAAVLRGSWYGLGERAMKSWVSRSVLGGGGRQHVVRVGLAVVLVGGMVWLLPVRRPGQEGGHHGGHEHAPALDAFERAGVVELREGHRTPGLRLATLTGETIALADQADKLVLVNFWATWCQPCTAEMPTLEALWRQYRGRGLVVLGVSVDRGAPRPLLDPYVARLGLTFPILLDSDQRASRDWRVTSLPATFVVRPGGEAVGLAFGAREWNSAEMQALLVRFMPASP
jgi:peroxiredoxin